jgi:hypothetical protein
MEQYIYKDDVISNVQSFSNIVRAFQEERGAREVKIFESRRDETIYAVCVFPGNNRVDIYSCHCFGEDETGRFFRTDDETDYVDVVCGWVSLEEE